MQFTELSVHQELGKPYTTSTLIKAFSATALIMAISACGKESVNSPGSQTVAQGETATFTVTPDSGFGIDSAIGFGGSLSGGQYTTGAVTADCSIEIRFSAIDAAKLDARANPGSVTLSCPGVLNVSPPG